MKIRQNHTKVRMSVSRVLNAPRNDDDEIEILRYARKKFAKDRRFRDKLLFAFRNENIKEEKRLRAGFVAIASKTDRQLDYFKESINYGSTFVTMAVCLYEELEDKDAAKGVLKGLLDKDDVTNLIKKRIEEALREAFNQKEENK